LSTRASGAGTRRRQTGVMMMTRTRRTCPPLGLRGEGDDLDDQDDRARGTRRGTDEFLRSPLLRAALWGASAGRAVANRNWRALPLTWSGYVASMRAPAAHQRSQRCDRRAVRPGAARSHQIAVSISRAPAIARGRTAKPPATTTRARLIGPSSRHGVPVLSCGVRGRQRLLGSAITNVATRYRCRARADPYGPVPHIFWLPPDHGAAPARKTTQKMCSSPNKVDSVRW